MSKNVKKGKINRVNLNQKLVITHLSNGKSISESAELVGVTRQTINNWMKNSAFIEKYDLAVEIQRIQLSEKYRQASTNAIEVLISIMNDENAKHVDRIRAATEIQKQNQAFREFSLIGKRLKKVGRRLLEKEVAGVGTIELEFANVPRVPEVPNVSQALAVSNVVPALEVPGLQPALEVPNVPPILGVPNVPPAPPALEAIEISSPTKIKTPAS